MTTAALRETITVMDDRRAAPRELSCIPAHVDTPDETERLALIHDISPDGALLFTREELIVDEPVQLSLYLRPQHEPPRPAAGRVVRVRRRERDRADVWQWEIGVKFDAPIHEYQPEIDELTRRQREVGVIKS